jgi:choline dehydrogenase-like flavoprotein
VTNTEHLVVGSGAGGALTAALLAEAGRDALVLEEGPWIDPDDVQSFTLDQMARQYRHGGVSAALGRPPIAYVEGRCAGGSTEVNAGLYHPPDEAILDRWGVPGLTAEALAPHAAEIERALSVQKLPGAAPPASTVLADGAEALGWPAMEVPRWYRYDDGVPRRQSMTQTFLPRAQKAGARVMCDTTVEKVLVERGRAIGVRTGGGTVSAEHVWVCAGAVGSAALLQRSGFRQGVGATLQMHPTIKLAARFGEPLDTAGDVPVHQVKPPGADISYGGSASSPGQIALVLSDDWPRNRAAAEDWERMAVYYAAIRPQGRGRIATLPRLRDPLVSFGLTRGDLALLGEGLENLGRILFAAGAETVFPSVRGGGSIARGQGAEALRGIVTRANASLMTVHLFSSIPLGGGAVDELGNVRGAEHLHVNDASLLPGAPGVNPQGIVMAIARRNVTAFLER